MKIKSVITLFFIALFLCSVLYAENNAVAEFKNGVKEVITNEITNDDPDALIKAAKNDDVGLVKILVKDEKINIDKTDDDGYTALMYAVKKRICDEQNIFISYIMPVGINGDSSY